jgi:hypothetical protein
LNDNQNVFYLFYYADNFIETKCGVNFLFLPTDIERAGNTIINNLSPLSSGTDTTFRCTTCGIFVGLRRRRRYDRSAREAGRELGTRETQSAVPYPFRAPSGTAMEIKGATFLYTLAGLMVTFAGFSALLLVLRQAAGGKVSRLDRFIARSVMSYIFVLTAGALLPSLLALYDLDEKWIWPASVALFGLPMLSLQLTYPFRRRRIIGEAPPPAIFAVFVVLGSAATLVTLAYVLAGLQNSAAVYISGLTIDFFTVIFGFLNALDIIMLRPIEASEPAPPQRPV